MATCCTAMALSQSWFLISVQLCFVCSTIATEATLHSGSGAGAHPVFCMRVRFSEGFEVLKRGHNVNMWLHPFFCMCVRFSVVWLEAQNISHMFTISSDASHFSFLPIH